MGAGKWLILLAGGLVLLFLGFRLGRGSRPSVPAEVGASVAAAGSAAADRLGAEPDRALAIGNDAPRVADDVRIAIVIDDLGRSLSTLRELQALAVELTYSVLPYETRTREVVAHLRQGRLEILCHLPMEALGLADPGPGALTRAMSPRELRQATRAALNAVPGSLGVNNHMGSFLSADRAAMTAILGVLGNRNLYFLDSRTSPDTVGYTIARELGLPATERQVFLDGDRDPAAITEQFHRLVTLAGERGSAVAIGHPYPETLDILRREIPRAVDAGVRFVRLSELVDDA